MMASGIWLTYIISVCISFIYCEFLFYILIICTMLSVNVMQDYNCDK